MVIDNPESERRYICERYGCPKIITRDHLIRRKTPVYLGIIAKEKAMPGYVRHGFKIGAFDEADLNIIGAGVAASGRR